MIKHVTILGAGLAGLTAAIDLRKHGYNVIVFEKAKKIGGRLHKILMCLDGTMNDESL